MTDHAQQQLHFFITATHSLLSDIKQWADELGLSWTAFETSITEEACGTYQIDELLLDSEQGEHIAEIIPVAAFVVGAGGRIDIKGLFDGITLIYLNKGGPSMIKTEYDDNGKPTTTHTHYFYREINEDGWYWIENKISRKGHKIDKEFFTAILLDISGYERNCCA